MGVARPSDDAASARRGISPTSTKDAARPVAPRSHGICAAPKPRASGASRAAAIDDTAANAVSAERDASRNVVAVMSGTSRNPGSTERHPSPDLGSTERHPSASAASSESHPSSHALTDALHHLGGYVRERGRDDRLWSALRSLGPALDWSGAAAPVDVPESVRDRWRIDARQTRARNVLLLAEVGRVVATLRRHGVPTLLLKGVGVVEQVYPDIGLRPMDDADLWVNPRDRFAAAGALARLGYQPVPPPPGRFDRLGRVAAAEWTYRLERGVGTVEVDLHWHVVADPRLRAALPDLDERAAWQRARPGHLTGEAVLQLEAVDAALLTAIAQVCGHPWSHPLGYLDLHLLLGRLDTSDWRRLVAQARAQRIDRPVAWALRFAAALFGTQPPPAVAADLAPPVRSRWLVERLIGADYLGIAPARREMLARDAFLATVLGPGAVARMLIATRSREHDDAPVVDRHGPAPTDHLRRNGAPAKSVARG